MYIGGLPELKKIEVRDGTLCFGGAVTYTELGACPDISAFPCIGQALSNLASPPIRNMGTPAGNMGTASPAGDFNLILLALGAEADLVSAAGMRTVPLSEFYLGVGKTVREKSELIAEIRIPLVKGQHSAFVKLGRRRGQDISRVSSAVSYLLDEGRIRDPRIAIGAVNAVPFRSGTFEEIVSGKTPDEAEAALEGAFPAEANPRRAYKRYVVTPMVRRAIREAQAQEGDWQWS